MKKTAFVSALLALSGVAASTVVGTPAGAAKPTVAAPVLTASATTVAGLEPCADLDALPTARCGVLSLPLDRTHPEKGTTSIAFALVPHTDTTQAGLGTIVPNPGGP